MSVDASTDSVRQMEAGAPWQHSIGDLFLRMAELYPRHTAIQRGGERLSYAELRSAALRLAQTIIDHDPAGTDPLAILVGHGIEAVIAITAALTAGRLYAVIDTSLPLAMQCRQLADLSPSLMIADRVKSALLTELAGAGCLHRCHTILVNDPVSDQAGQAELQQAASNPDAMAAILYSSGSTGQAKGIMHTHRTLLRHVTYVNEVCGVTASDCIIALHPLHLGLSQARLLGALVSGARLLLYDASTQGINGLGDLLQREGVTILATVPSLFRSLLSSLPAGQVLTGVRVVQLGATTVEWADLGLFKRHFSPGAMFRLVYAASEALGCTEMLMDHSTKEMDGPLPVGRPVEDKEISIVDADGCPVATGESGEIAVRSAFLSPGFWRRPEATSHRFLPDAEGGQRRTYLTGDRGRMRGDGLLEHLGRQDLMVKVAGHRIELEMVEQALRQATGVAEAAVVVRGDWRRDHDGAQSDAADETRLVAYFVPAGGPARAGGTSMAGQVDGSAAPTASSLRRTLAQTLPEPMIPAVFVALPALPYTAGGKVDRRALAALPPPQPTRPALDVPYAAPWGVIETRIAAIWADVLGIDRVGADDPFLDLGGNSILAARIVAGVLRDPALSWGGMATSISVATLFATPTVAGMAALIGARQNESAGRMESLLTELEALSEAEAEASVAAHDDEGRTSTGNTAATEPRNQ